MDLWGSCTAAWQAGRGCTGCETGRQAGLQQGRHQARHRAGSGRGDSLIAGLAEGQLKYFPPGSSPRSQHPQGKEPVQLREGGSRQRSRAEWCSGSCGPAPARGSGAQSWVCHRSAAWRQHVAPGRCMRYLSRNWSVQDDPRCKLYQLDARKLLVRPAGQLGERAEPCDLGKVHSASRRWRAGCIILQHLPLAQSLSRVRAGRWLARGLRKPGRCAGA